MDKVSFNIIFISYFPAFQRLLHLPSSDLMRSMSSKDLQWNAVFTEVLVRGVIGRHYCIISLDSSVLLYVTHALIF
jgi:hypothetical protein